MNTFRKHHVVCKENAMADSKKPTGRTPNHLPGVDASPDRLREVRTEAVKAGVLEGFAEIERGEVVEMTLDDLKDELRW